LKIMNNQIQRIGQVLAMAALFGAALITPCARGEAQAQSGSDRVSVNLSDPTRPAFVKASSVNGSITVKAYEGKEVIVEARGRNEEGEKPSSGPKRLNISTTGLTVEEENNEVRILKRADERFDAFKLRQRMPAIAQQRKSPPGHLTASVLLQRARTVLRWCGMHLMAATSLPIRTILM